MIGVRYKVEAFINGPRGERIRGEVPAGDDPVVDFPLDLMFDLVYGVDEAALAAGIPDRIRTVTIVAHAGEPGDLDDYNAHVWHVCRPSQRKAWECERDEAAS